MSTRRYVSRRILLFVILGAVQAADGTGSLAQSVADPAGLERVDFTLAGVHYQILVPQGAPVALPSGQIGFIEIRYPRLTRNIRLFRLGQPNENQDKYAHSIALSSGAVLQYSIDRNIGGGSSGPEEELKGQVRIGQHALSVTCHDQREWPGSPEPEWCVSYLHHLTIEKAR